MGNKLRLALSSTIEPIQDFDKKKIVYDFVESLPDELCEKGASSTGKHHPECSNGPGGLIFHTRMVVQIAKVIHSSFGDDLDFDTMRTAAIIHDLAKYGEHCEEEYVTHRHPIVIMDMFRSFVLCNGKRVKPHIKEWAQDVMRLVSTHMGRWTTHKKDHTVLPKPEKSDELILHWADYIASQKWLDIKTDQHGLFGDEMPF